MEKSFLDDNDNNNNNNNGFKVRFGVLERHRGPLLAFRQPLSWKLGSLGEEVEKSACQKPGQKFQ